MLICNVYRLLNTFDELPDSFTRLLTTWKMKMIRPISQGTANLYAARHQFMKTNTVDLPEPGSWLSLELGKMDAF